MRSEGFKVGEITKLNIGEDCNEKKLKQKETTVPNKITPKLKLNIYVFSKISISHKNKFLLSII